jgi:hypothetical protein
MRKRFENVLVVDWSARAKPAPPSPSRDAIWLCFRGPERIITEYCRTRWEAEAIISELLASCAGRCFAGFDFSFAYPSWAMHKLGGWRELWAWLEQSGVEDDRFACAARINAALGVDALWAAPQGVQTVPLRKPAHGLPEFRTCELSLSQRPQSGFKLYTAGSVGSQMLVGLPMLERLRLRFGPALAVWPFEQTAKARIVLGEVWPSLLGRPPASEAIPDRWQVEELSRRLFEHGVATPLDLPPEAQEEGWIVECPYRGE